MIHVMHDYESWALHSTRPVLISHGAVKFDGTEIIDRFHVRIDPADCQRFGLEIEAETVEWWMDPDRDAARAQLATMGKVDLVSALSGYMQWVNETPADQLGSSWSNGSNFDNARIKEICRIVGVDWAFKYNQEECYRTIKNRFPDMAFERLGVHHGALDDAESQAVHLQQICWARGIPL